MLPKKSCYQTSATAVGGRIGGAASADGRLRVRLDDPADASGKGTNPEQLFAAAYAACFLSAIRKVADMQGIAIAPDANVTADVALGDGEGAAALSITLAVDLAGLDEGTVERLTVSAHELCPYSKAIRGDTRVDIRIA